MSSGGVVLKSAHLLITSSAVILLKWSSLPMFLSVLMCYTIGVHIHYVLTSKKQTKQKEEEEHEEMEEDGVFAAYSNLHVDGLRVSSDCCSGLDEVKGSKYLQCAQELQVSHKEEYTETEEDMSLSFDAEMTFGEELLEEAATFEAEFEWDGLLASHGIRNVEEVRSLFDNLNEEEIESLTKIEDFGEYLNVKENQSISEENQRALLAGDDEDDDEEEMKEEEEEIKEEGEDVDVEEVWDGFMYFEREVEEGNDADIDEDEISTDSEEETLKVTRSYCNNQYPAYKAANSQKSNGVLALNKADASRVHAQVRNEFLKKNLPLKEYLVDLHNRTEIKHYTRTIYV